MVCLLFAGSEVAVEPDACGTDSSARWTEDALGWSCLRTFFGTNNAVFYSVKNPSPVTAIFSLPKRKLTMQLIG